MDAFCYPGHPDGNAKGGPDARHTSTPKVHCDIALSPPPRSPDRNRSPVAVSRKREYFKYPPETIGDFAPAAANFRNAETDSQSQKPDIPGAGLVGWRRSADRTRLRANSLLTGNFTGKNAISGFFGPIAWQKVAVPHQFSHNSLRKLTGKLFRRP